MKNTYQNYFSMIKLFGDLILPLILISLGVFLRKGLIPNTKNTGKLWLLLVVPGCLNIIVEIISFLIRD